ncbi:MAG TPA: TIGR01620 family protein [Rhabdaerophilum sp.]|nr:TIGR01620 family protein [Rhabdaerophilum sp.]
MSNDPAKPRAVSFEPREPASPRGARAYRLEEGGGAKSGEGARVPIETSLDEEVKQVVDLAAEDRVSGIFSWSSLFWSALTLLVGAYLADGVYAFYLSMEKASPWIGQAVLGLIGIVVLGVAVFLFRELFAILRMRKVGKLRTRALDLIAAPEREAVRDFLRDLSAFYARDPGATAGRAEIARVLDEIHDPATLLGIAERALLAPKDDLARAAIAAAAQRVSVVTALSPRAIIDVGFVLAQSFGLIRRLSMIYGGRASGLGLFRLAARVLSHLTVTGGMAVADSFLSQVLGAGIAARLSAKLGEGVLNGILTARVGIAASDVCRPLPFHENSSILLSEVVSISITQNKVAENTAA